MVTTEQQQAIAKAIATERIRSLTHELQAAGAPAPAGWERGCEQLAAALQQAGASRVEVQSHPCGSEHRHYSWSAERRPQVEQAELWLQQPDGSERLLCRASEQPSCCMGALRATPAEGEVFEVVDVGFGTRSTDYRSHRMAGKIALATGHHFAALQLEALVNRQAEGLLCGPGRLLPDPDQLLDRQLEAPSLFGGHRPFGFNLSSRQLDQLSLRLAAGEAVFVRVRIRLALDSGCLPLVSGLLEGSDLADQRLLLLADLSSAEGLIGAACQLEALRALWSAIVAGSCPPLRRSVELLAVPGPQALVAWLQAGASPLPRQALFLTAPTGGKRWRTRVHAPLSPVASFAPDLLADHLDHHQQTASEQLPPEVARYRATPMVLPLQDRPHRVPLCWVRCTAADGAPHAGLRRPPLQQLTAGLAAAVLDLCVMPDEDAPQLLCRGYLAAERRLAQAAEALRRRGQLTLQQEPGNSTSARHLLWLAEQQLQEQLRREQGVLQSAVDFLAGQGLQAVTLAEANADLERSTSALLRALQVQVTAALPPRARLAIRRRPLSALERRASEVVPHRTFEGPFPALTLLRDAPPAERDWLAHSEHLLANQPAAEEILQWVDSRRSLQEVYDLLLIDYPQAELRLIWRYLEVLQSIGLVRLDERERRFTPPGTSAA